MIENQVTNHSYCPLDVSEFELRRKRKYETCVRQERDGKWAGGTGRTNCSIAPSESWQGPVGSHMVVWWKRTLDGASKNRWKTSGIQCKKRKQEKETGTK